MSINIAVAGKGGTGKTTTCSLIIRSLMDKNKGPILVLDADPNSNLNELLGVKITKTVGMLREDFKKEASRMSKGLYKNQVVEMNIHQSLVENKGFDLLVMGRGEGSGCYCYANDLFRRYIDILQDNYKYVVMDNEAGMEHLSRRTTRDLKYLLIISDPSPKGILTANRIRDLAKELKLKVEKIFLIIGRVNNKLDDKLKKNIEESGFDILGCINADKNIYEMDISEKTIFNIPDDSIALKQVKKIVENLNL